MEPYFRTVAGLNRVNVELATVRGREDGLPDGLPECVSANGAGEVRLDMQMLGERIPVSWR